MGRAGSICLFFLCSSLFYTLGGGGGPNIPRRWAKQYQTRSWVVFSWLFRGPSVYKNSVRAFFVTFSWFFRGFFVAPVLGKFYAYSPWKSSDCVPPPKIEGEEFQGLKSWACLPKFCRTFEVLCESSSAGFFYAKGSAEPSCRAQKVLQNSGRGSGARVCPLRIGFFFLETFKRKPHVRYFSASNSRAGNGCANFLGAWDFWFFLQANLHAHGIPNFWGGGVLGCFWGRWGKVPVLFVATFFLTNPYSCLVIKLGFESSVPKA